MKKLLLIPVLAMVFGSCCKRFYPSSVQDSIRVETRYEYIEMIRDTIIYVPIPYEVERIVTRDTTSHLETSVAYSDAAVHEGLLYHSLVNKNVSLSAPVQIKEVEIVRDSIVYRDKVETIIQEVYKQTWWQKLWGTAGKWLAGIFVILIAFKTTKNFIKI